MAHEEIARQGAGGEAAGAVEPQAAAATAGTSATQPKLQRNLGDGRRGKDGGLTFARSSCHRGASASAISNGATARCRRLPTRRREGRSALAMRGSKEERSILVRDGTKLVALSGTGVAQSFRWRGGRLCAAQMCWRRWLRAIPLKQRFAKNYSIMRNFVYNPAPRSISRWD